MSNFFSRLFSKKTESKANGAKGFIEETLASLLEAAHLDLDFEVTAEEQKEGAFIIEIFGADEEMLRAKEGQLLDSIQLFLTRVTQHQLPDEKVLISVDNAGFREETNQSLIDLADKLKDVALEKGKPVYFRALPPRDRKVIHQHLAQDERIKSRSVGDGLYKKIKIFPLKEGRNSTETPDVETV